MKKYGLFLGLLLSTVLMSSPALAATVGMPSGIGVPATDSDGLYNVTIGASSTAGVTYELYENDIVIYSGTARKFLVTGRTAGSYDYKVNAIKAGMDPSPFTATKTSVVSGNGLPQVVAPSGIAATANDTDGRFSVTIGSSSTTDALYNFEESIDGGPFTPVLTNSTSRQYAATGKLSGKKYTYRAYASKAGMNNSAYTTTTTTYVASSDFCISCHSSDGGAPDNNTAWASSRHGNSNAAPAALTNSCSQCHSPNTELANGSMAVTCLGCHSYNGTDGNGHPVVSKINALATCGSCHNSHISASNSIAAKVAASKHTDGRGHNTTISCERCHTTEGALQWGALYTGDKSQSTALTAYAAANGLTQIPVDQGPTCAACHDHSGNMRTVPNWDPNQNATADQFDLCTSCHTLFRNDGTVASSNATNGFYHNTAWHRMIASTHYDDPATVSVIEGYNLRKTGSNPCFDCHAHELFTNTHYAGATRKSIAGDAPGTGVLLTDTEKKTTIHTDWAQSAHAGGLLTNKYAVARLADGQTKSDTVALVDTVMATGVTDSAIGNAWAHYDWDSVARQSCQQCHTSTGNANFMMAQTAGTAYNNKKNDFSHLSGWVGTKDASDQFTSATVSNQNELLYCWGCHSSVESGALLAPMNKGIKPGYNVNGVALQLPSLGTSNACVGCHSGRGNIQSLLTTAPTGGIDPTVALTTSTVPKSTATATSTHYLNAAATILQDKTKVGYEFPALNYANPAYFKHNTVGCVDCHMSTGNSHSFAVVSKDAAGIITAINTQAACNTCHTTYPIDAAKLEEEKLGYEEALHAFEHELQLNGYVFVNAHPYFYVGTTSGADLFFKSPAAVVPAVYSATATDRNGDTVIDGLDWIDVNLDGIFDAADLVKQPATWATQGDIGAGHNFNYLHHEPGAYAHNRFYTKRLIFDSIDWLDNNSMDGTITIDADTYPEAALWFGATAPAAGSFVATRP
ncbi:MAG: hypothetical protein U1D97_03710 [Desulfuromonadales bacterium]|nr:hypothetical protein [Desulfuromonadales bacterium]